MNRDELKLRLRQLGIKTYGNYIKKSDFKKYIKADEKEESIKIVVNDADASQNADLNNLLMGKNIKKESAGKPDKNKYFYELIPKTGKLDRDTVKKLLDTLHIDWDFYEEKK